MSRKHGLYDMTKIKLVPCGTFASGTHHRKNAPYSTVPHGTSRGRDMRKFVPRGTNTRYTKEYTLAIILCSTWNKITWLYEIGFYKTKYEYKESKNLYKAHPWCVPRGTFVRPLALCCSTWNIHRIILYALTVPRGTSFLRIRTYALHKQVDEETSSPFIPIGNTA